MWVRGKNAGWMPGNYSPALCALLGEAGKVEGLVRVQEAVEGRILTPVGSLLISVSEAGD